MQWPIFRVTVRLLYLDIAAAKALGSIQCLCVIPAAQVLNGLANAVESLAFQPAGELVAAGSSSGTVKLWDLAEGKGKPQRCAIRDEVSRILKTTSTMEPSAGLPSSESVPPHNSVHPVVCHVRLCSCQNPHWAQAERRRASLPFILSDRRDRGVGRDR